MYISKRFLAVIAMLGLVLAVSACSPRAHTRGNLPDPKKVSQLKAGDISREEVIEFLGSPSSRASFGDEVWFYIQNKQKRLLGLSLKLKTVKFLLCISIQMERLIKLRYQA
jgi:outer membrane protein assembly factor BamE (lipoprotein component of BamABCDE complex)